MKIIKIILSIIGAIFIVPFYFVLWITITGAIMLAKASLYQEHENLLPLLGGFAIILTLQLIWLVWIIFPLAEKIFGK